jgi:hypothetical protein
MDRAARRVVAEWEDSSCPLRYCSFGKIKNHGTHVDFAFFNIVW